MANVKENQNVETLNSKEAFFLKYKKAIVYAVIALIVIIAGIILYKNYVKTPRENKASTELAKGQELFANQMYEKALKGDSTKKAGNIANLYAGLCYANMGKWQEAANFIEKYSGANDMLISPAAMSALGDAYANLNQLDKAVSSFKKAAKMADSQAEGNVNFSLSPIFLMKAARILESQKKNDEALKIYQDIKAKYVNSPIYSEIDKYIERVSVK